MYVLLKLRRVALTLLTAIFVVFLTESVQAVDNLSHLVNISGRQRMLSQRIAKDYFYLGQNIAKKDARLQLKAAITRFENGHIELKKVEDSEVREMLSFVEIIFAEFKSLVTKNYNKKDAASVLELSETLLGSCHEVVLKFEGMTNQHLDEIINISGRQRMLSQRIAKYYIAYQAGFQDDDTVQKLKIAVMEFESALEQLQKEKRNTRQIKMLLTKIKQRWEQIKPYFLRVRKGNLPLMVLTNTDEVTQIAHQVTRLYAEVTVSQ